MSSTEAWVHDMSDMAEHHRGQEVRLVFLFDALTISPFRTMVKLTIPIGAFTWVTFHGVYGRDR